MLLLSLTCSGVAVMELPGACEACVGGAGLGEGLGVTAGGEAGARYLVMAGSTSGVPWGTHPHSQRAASLQCVFTNSSYPLRRVDGRQGVQVGHRELDAFPLQLLVNVNHAGQVGAASEGVGPGLQQKGTRTCTFCGKFCAAINTPILWRRSPCHCAVWH